MVVCKRVDCPKFKFDCDGEGLWIIFYFVLIKYIIPNFF